MMASAAAATSVVLGTEVEISHARDARRSRPPTSIADAYAATPHAVRTAMSICGEPARLVQLVPNAFVVRMSSALDDMGSEIAGAPARRPTAAGVAHATARAVAGRHPGPRLGRARPRADALRAGRRPPRRRRRRARQARPTTPIDLYVNGTRFATGRLVVVDGTDWAVRIEHVLRQHQRTVNLEWRWPDGPNPGSRRCRLHAEDGLRRARPRAATRSSARPATASRRSSASRSSSPSSRRSTSRCPRRTASPRSRRSSRSTRPPA